MMLRVVVFPHPEGPRSDRNSPLYTSRSRLCRTGVAPYDMATPRSSTSMSTGSAGYTQLVKIAVQRWVQSPSFWPTTS